MKRVMIVEDEILVRVGLRSFLNWEEHGYTISAEASDGREALEQIETDPPDIILTDLKMSGMNGFELIRQCRERFPEIHFIVLSSYNDFDNVREAMKLGADDYIFKLSSSPDGLLKTLDEVSEKIDAQLRTARHRQDQKMNDFIAKNTSALKRTFIRDAIRGNVANAYEYIEDFSEILQLKVSLERPYMILYLSIDNYEHVRGGQDDEGIFKTSVENIIYKALEGRGNAEVFNYENGDFIVLIQPEMGALPAPGKTDMTEIFERTALYVKRYAGAEISGYASPECCGLSELREVAGNIQRRLYKRLPCDCGHLSFYMDNMREEIAYIEKYVYENVGKELTVSQVSQVANMSESYFSHVFKKEVGQSFTNYVNSVRINKAKELLLHSDLKINEIAAEVGLENANYFSTLFKKMTGVSPVQFRERG